MKGRVGVGTKGSRGEERMEERGSSSTSSSKFCSAHQVPWIGRGVVVVIFCHQGGACSDFVLLRSSRQFKNYFLSSFEGILEVVEMLKVEDVVRVGGWGGSV